jgi:hypothetical protein
MLCSNGVWFLRRFSPRTKVGCTRSSPHLYIKQQYDHFCSRPGRWSCLPLCFQNKRSNSGLHGAGRARELALTARTISADTALSYGLVTEVVPRQGKKGRDEVQDRADELAKQIASKPTIAAEGTKRVMVWGVGKTVADGLEYVAAHNGALLYSQDLQVACP